MSGRIHQMHYNSEHRSKRREVREISHIASYKMLCEFHSFYGCNPGVKE